jgi:polar amino acid transport system substrate-binding protein
MTKFTFGLRLRRTAAIAGVALMASVLTAGADGFDANAPLADLVPQAYKDKGTLVVGTQPDFEPANFTPIGEAQIKGYNVDLMEAMAQKLGLSVEWQKVPFDQLLIGMQSKKFDVAIAGMTDRKTRQEQVDFLDYQVVGSVFVVAKGNPKGITGAVDGGCGVTLGDVKGSDAQRLVDMMAKACEAAGKPPTTLISYPNTGDKNLALTSGRVDAMVWPDMSVPILEREIGDVIDSMPIDFEPKVFLGMTFNKDEAGLRDAFLAALKAIHDDGTYAAILKKWDVEVINLDEPGINLAKE